MTIQADQILQALTFAAKNKHDLQTILMNLNPSDPSTGTLPVSESLVNNTILEYIRQENIHLPIEQPEIEFSDGQVILRGNVSGETKFPFLSRIPTLTLRFRILQIHINDAKHTITVSSENGLAVRGLLAAAIARLDMLSSEGDRITIDLNKTGLGEKIPSWFTAAFLSCDHGYLNLAYQIKKK